MSIQSSFERKLKAVIKRRGLSTDEESYLFLLMFLTEVFGGGMHVVLLIFFSIFDIYLFLAINVISISVYSLCCYMTYKRYYLASAILATAEVCAYVLLSSVYFGVQNGIILFLVLIIEVQVTIPYSKNSSTRLLVGLVVVLANILAVLIGLNHEPIYTMTKSVETILQVMCVEMTFFGTIILLSIGNYINRFILDYNLELQEELKSEAVLDPLTGLENRRGAANRSQEFMESTDDWMVAMLDIDNFKSINDTYGHQTGDEVLKEVAYLISANIKQKDTAFRWGGEEFLICLRNTGVKDVFQTLEKIRTEISDCVIKKNETEINVTVTMGVAPFSRDNPIKGIELSDELLYRGKREGKNRVIMPEVSDG